MRQDRAGERTHASGRRRPRPALRRRRARGAVAGAVHRHPHVAAHVGPRRAGPQRLHLQRHRHDRGLRLGPGHRHAPAGHRPARGHAPRHAAARREEHLVVRRHRRRRVRALGHGGLRRPRGRAASTDRHRDDGPGAGTPARRASRASGTEPVPALPGVEDGYPAGLEIGRRLVAAGTSTDDGTRIWLRDRTTDAPARVVYAHAEDAGVGALSDDETLLAISHSEHGDSRHPAVRVVRTADGSAVAEKSDGPGRGLTPLAFAPVPGDQRLLLLHERRGREELLVWDVAAGTETETRDRPARRARGRLRPRRDGAARLAHACGAHPAVPLRPRDRRADRPAHRAGLRGLGRGPSGRHGRVLLLVGRGAADRPRAAPRRHGPRADHAAGRSAAGLGAGRGPVGGRPGRAGARPRRPARGRDRTGARGRQPARRPARRRRRPLLRGPGAVGGRRVHGRRDQLSRLDGLRQRLAGRHRGPPGADRAGGRRGRRRRAAWPRGSSTRSGPWWRAGRGAATWRCWRPGRSPERWAGVLAGVPVADYLAAYADEMEQLRAFDRALFGGSPEQRPEVYRASSPLTYVDAVAAPVLVLAGENDPRCPIRQIDNYLDALAARSGDVRGQPVRRRSRFARGRGDDAARRHRGRVRPPGLRPLTLAHDLRRVDDANSHSECVRLSTSANVCVMLRSKFVTQGDNDGVVPEEVASWRCGAFTLSWRTDRAGSASWPRQSAPQAATSSRCTSSVSRRTAARSPTSCWSGCPRASTHPS